MKLQILGSSSSGNSYLFTSQSGETLIVEAGCKMSELKHALDFDFENVSGCILSHEHGDHAKYAKEIMKYGVDVYASLGTFLALGLHFATNHRVHLLSHLGLKSIGSFTVKPFDVKHDAKQPFGFIIKHAEMGVTLFLTDSYYVEYTFPGLNNVLVECNYDENILSEREQSGRIHASVSNRVRTSHMELSTLKTMLLANNLSKVNNIVLLHLSDGNSHAVNFQNEIHSLTGKTVIIADKGMTLTFDKEPF